MRFEFDLKNTFDVRDIMEDGSKIRNEPNEAARQVKEFLQRHAIVLFCLAAVAVPLAYTLYTNHIWEDFFITFRCSKNLLEGNGLVYQIGERVHVFTSPLGVLLPALCHLLTGSKGHIQALWLFRLLFCVPAFVLGGIFVLKTFRESPIRQKTIPLLFAALFYLFDVKAVMFSMNGMETAFMLCFLSISIFLMFRGISENEIPTGVCWAGMMWTRPDSCFYIAALMAAIIIFGESNERRARATAILKAAAITTIIYLPWFMWVWWYYGSPIPNTVLAKSAVNSFNPLQILADWPSHAAWAFAPVYPAFSKWPSAVSVFAYIPAFFASLYWLLPVKDKFGKPLSMIFFLLSIYFAFMRHPCAWYYPPFAMVGCMTLISGVWHL
ncbi:MAG: hypothetical protein KAG97_06075, partial [Victivallales bacterium]|nr:hypothetical protein [Victivallales bacterium]